ncbi:MAG: dihydrolipoyl dehydrogenase, partial [Pseudomonadota bacterium]
SAHGGTCLNVGCIPSKALLHASELFEEAGHGFEEMGITAKPELDLTKMMAFKTEGIDGNTQGIDYLFKKNKITSFTGFGKISGANEVTVTPDEGDATVLGAKHIVIATGSDVARLPGIEIDEKRIVSSTGALELDGVPEHLVVIGGGIIGLELGSVWRRLGAKVTVVEFLDRITPTEDAEVSKKFMQILKKQGIEFKLGHKVTKAEAGESSVTVTIEPSAGGDAQQMDASVLLVSVGRTPFTDGLGLEDVGVQKDNRGRVMVDDHYKTNVDGIYAIGDVIVGPMLAHKAEDEGVALAEILAGQAGHVNYDVIPSVIYTYPEVASVGKTEEALKEAGIEYRKGSFPFMANGRAKVNRQTDGFVKVLADATTDRILGVHIVGPQAGNMIAEAAVIMEFGGSAEDLARTCHAHPTLTEAVKEAALAVDGRALHM